MKPLKIEEMVAKKLALWHTRTFRPILTHEELEPIMAAAGFVPLPPAAPQEEGGQATAAVAWREYASRSEAARRRAGPRPRLPYPRIDGLHLMAYKAFLVSLEFYLGPTLVPNLFHVRTMSLTRLHDRVFEKAYRPMKDCEMDDKGILVYREGTLDHITKMICSQYGGDDNNDDQDDDSNSSSTACIIGCTNNYIKKANCNDDLKNAVSLSYLVPLKDLFPSGDVISSLS